MSRVIKFRAWNKYAKFMTYRPRLDYDNATGEQICFAYDDNGQEVLLPLMQFTGLTDCNGVEIYEGDIVTATCVDQDSCCGATYEYTFCVQWRHHRWYFDDGKDNKRVLGQYPPLKHCSFESCCREGDELKVIGNIYEHPHLLDHSSETDGGQR